MKTYVISDTHFGHANIIKLADRPFKNVDEMNKTIINNWNSIVNDEDIVYILGDFSFKGKNADYYAKQLKGRKILIKGNHDKIDKESRKCFEKILNYAEIEIDNQIYILTHYPILSWNKMYGGSIQLYGHLHKNSKYFENITLPNAFCVNCEFRNYLPVEIKKFKMFKEDFIEYTEMMLRRK